MQLKPERQSPFCITGKLQWIIGEQWFSYAKQVKKLKDTILEATNHKPLISFLWCCGTVPGHVLTGGLHETVSLSLPSLEQSLPPFCGAGLLHSLSRVFTPCAFPHVLEHWLQLPQGPYPPCTSTKWWKQAQLWWQNSWKVFRVLFSVTAELSWC